MNLRIPYRHLLLSILLLAMLTACSQTPSPAAEPSTPESGAEAAAPQTEEEAPATREFEHGKGVSTIPTHPERIVAIQYTGAMLALGVKPVGADNEWSAYPLLADEWQGIEHVGDPWTGLNLEKIVELDPDLIVTHVEATYDELSKIAPTLWIPWLQYNPQEQITLFGDILGKQEEAAAWLEQFQTKVEDTRAEVANLIGEDETVAIFNIRPQNLFIYGDKAMGGYVIYDLLQLHAPELIQQAVLDEGVGQLEVSMELLPDYANADYLFLSVLEDENGTAYADEVMNSPLFQQLPAVQQGHVLPLNWDTYFTTDPLSTLKQLDAFAELLAKE
ncbi:hypothetical protein PA598K_03276 [Paenibacillus sp. 598K]|uniref:ABC transporter substrate-binding protein n=1 Tax=Paenibacillus sp. 598K TaxID=1117987 RepID=UPI000FFACF2E|nr:ABC transporter substrate-binding protein [Paenibacillus sp. 598K]GBF74906.1 hypothetical protein PA598K_03276 [Paenibacillus sp. 598K]